MKNKNPITLENIKKLRSRSTLPDGKRPNEWEKSVLASSASADESEIVELGHLVLHECRVILELGAEILVVSGLDGDQGAIADLAESNHLERDRQSFVRSPVRWEYRAHDVWRTWKSDMNNLLRFVNDEQKKKSFFLHH